MRSLSRILTTGGVIAAVIGIGILVGWLASRPPAFPPSPSASAGPANKAETKRVAATASHATTSHGTALEPVETSDPSETDTNLITDWEARIDTILRDNSDVEEKARKMLALFPRMTEEGQTETAQHISNLLADEDYPAFGRYLTNSKTAVGALDVMMMDVLNRPNGLKIPLLLEVARNPEHPKAAEAKETLQMYLEEDYGTNWTVWQEKVDAWLKDNPD